MFFSFPSSAWERLSAKLRFAACRTSLDHVERLPKSSETSEVCWPPRTPKPSAHLLANVATFDAGRSLTYRTSARCGKAGRNRFALDAGDRLGRASCRRGRPGKAVLWAGLPRCKTQGTRTESTNMPAPSPLFVPAGTPENSPPIHRWDTQTCQAPAPSGATESRKVAQRRRLVAMEIARFCRP